MKAQDVRGKSDEPNLDARRARVAWMRTRKSSGHLTGDGDEREDKARRAFLDLLREDKYDR